MQKSIIVCIKSDIIRIRTFFEIVKTSSNIVFPFRRKRSKLLESVVIYDDSSDLIFGNFSGNREKIGICSERRLLWKSNNIFCWIGDFLFYDNFFTRSNSGFYLPIENL